MTKKVSIPGCGVPTGHPYYLKQSEIVTQQHSTTQESTSSQTSPAKRDQFSYNLNKYKINHESTNLYSSLAVPGRLLSEEFSLMDNNVPGGFLTKDESTFHHLPTEDRTVSNIGQTNLSEATKKEILPRYIPTIQEIGKGYILQERDNVGKKAKEYSVHGFNSPMNFYNYFCPSDMGMKNNLLSTSSAKEISNYSNKPLISITTKTNRQTTKTTKESLNSVISSGTGSKISYTSPHETGFDNKVISTSTARELSTQTKQTVQDIPQPSNILAKTTKQQPKTVSSGLLKHNVVFFGSPSEIGFDNNNRISSSSIKEISPNFNRTTFNVPRSFIDTQHKPHKTGIVHGKGIQSKSAKNDVQNSVISFGTGSLAPIISPWEMGFNNKPMSTSSAREISNRTKKPITTLPQQTKNNIVPISVASPSTQNVFSSGTGAGFSLSSPWEGGFDNKTISVSSSREISPKMNKTVKDIPHASKPIDLAPIPFGRGMSKERDIKSLPAIDRDVISYGNGSGSSFYRPNEMGFDNKTLSVAGIREISSNYNKTTNDVAQGFNQCVVSRGNVETGIMNKTSQVSPLSSTANVGLSLSFSYPFEMGFDNKNISKSSAREIAPNTKKTVQSSTTRFIQRNTPMEQGESISNEYKNYYQDKELVGAGLASQGPPIAMLLPPLGIKGILNAKGSRNTITHDMIEQNSEEVNYGLELQEPLESAFMPNAYKKREQTKTGTSSINFPIVSNGNKGKYNLLTEELNDPRMSVNIFGIGLGNHKHTTDSGMNKKPISPPLQLTGPPTSKDTGTDMNISGPKGNIVALNSLPSSQSGPSTPTADFQNFPFMEMKRPSKNELVSLDAVTAPSIINKTDIRSQSNTTAGDMTAGSMTTGGVKEKYIVSGGTALSGKTAISDSTINHEPLMVESAEPKIDYWKQGYGNGHTKVLKGSRRPATDDQISGKTSMYVDLNDPRTRRRSLGSASYSKEIGDFPSLIDPQIPTYGFTTEGKASKDYIPTDYYLTSSQNILNRERSSEEKPANISNEEVMQTLSTDENQNAKDFVPSVANTSYPNERFLQETTPRDYNKGWEETNNTILHSLPPRRKSRASIVFSKFAKAVTKSTI